MEDADAQQPPRTKAVSAGDHTVVRSRTWPYESCNSNFMYYEAEEGARLRVGEERDGVP